MFKIEDDVETKPAVWRSEIRVKKTSPAIEKLLKYFKKPKALDDYSRNELKKMMRGALR